MSFHILIANFVVEEILKVCLISFSCLEQFYLLSYIMVCNIFDDD